jgi:hypothetical protein
MEFEVSGFKVLKSWLGYRMLEGKGRQSSDLDRIRPEFWNKTPELLQVIAMIEQTLSRTPAAAQILESITRGPLFAASELPTPQAHELLAPSV